MSNPSSVAQITNETSRLQAVIIHRPGPELDLMTPDHIEAVHVGEGGQLEPNPSYLLFDDLVLLSRLREEHDQIVAVLRATCGHENTHDIRDLLRSVLHDPLIREQVITESIALEAEYGGATSEAREVLESLDPHRLVRTLIRGITSKGTPRLLRWPSPNLLFARDLGVIVGEARLLTYAATPARRREMMLSRTLLRHHPVFGPGPVLDVGERVDNPRIEGGDVLVLSKRDVLIGVGVRTDETTARAAAGLLHETGVDNVHLVRLRAARATMHLDTVFTLIDVDRCLAYAPTVLEANGCEVTTLSRDRGERPRKGSLLDILADCGHPLRAVRCGGDDPINQTREQWSDGANAFALGPGKFMLYARNEQTLRRLNREGFEVLTAEEYCRNAALILESDRKVVVAIDGSELSRGRGGPRCLTFPLLRAGTSRQAEGDSIEASCGGA